MGRSICRVALAFTLTFLCWGTIASSAFGAGYEFDPVLSLTGNCATAGIDPVPDPDCPYPAPPAGPSGRFDDPRSIAVDFYGNEYVASYAGDGSKGRIDVFDDEGHFITEFADPFGPRSLAVDSKGNLYVFEQKPGANSEVVRYTPTIYEPEVGNIEYGTSRFVVQVNTETNTGGIAIDSSNDRLFAVFGNTFIAEYGSADEGNKPLSTITHEKLKSSNWIAIDAERRRLYASHCQKEGVADCGVLVFEADSPYGLLKEIDGSDLPSGEFRSGKGWTSIAVDEDTGHFFVEDLEQTDNVYEFNEAYEYVSTINLAAFQGGNALQIALSNSQLNPDAMNHRYLFVPVALAAGRALAFRPSPIDVAPNVDGLSATNIGETEAELRATIDPGSSEVTYVFEYVALQDFEEKGFMDALIGAEGTVPAKGGEVDVSALLKGLVPGTPYRFRVIAESSAGSDEEEGSFATYMDAVLPSECSNHLLRTGPSALLPDCRAYELVTPPDTNGRPPKGAGVEGDRFGMVNSSPLGDAASFELIGGALPGTEGTGGFHGDPYKATRGTTGWTTIPIGPSGAESTQPVPGSVSPDQNYSFWAAGGEGTAVVDGGLTRYVRYPDGHSAVIGRGSLGLDPRAKGMLITEGGGHIIFQTDNFTDLAQQLEPNAPPTGTEAVYDRTADEVTHVVSLLPGGVAPPAGANATYVGASADGEGIAFSIGNILYLRVSNSATYEIGENVTFAGVSAGGKRVFYVKGGDLYAFDSDTKEEIAFTAVGNATPVNVASDGTRAYFVTTSVIPGGGQNPNGAFAKAGQQNLYLSEEGGVTFVATVTVRDVEGEVVVGGTRTDGLGLWTEALAKDQPGANPSRVTPDGSVLLFQSRANLDGYDSGNLRQIYRYDSGLGRLHCISCIPTQVPATGGASLQSFSFSEAAAPFSRYGFVSNLRPDGRRAFFESTEALVSTDTDGVQDVYEWEDQGIGSCTRPGGCIYLISHGHSIRDDYLFGVSRSGDDVFFTTDDVLVPQDKGTLSIYDARVNGGFSSPTLGPCEELDGCRGHAGAPPLIPAPRSELPGPSKTARKCPKGKRKVKRMGKVRCIKKHRKNRHSKVRSSAQKGAPR